MNRNLKQYEIHNKLITKLEKIQRSFMKHIFNMYKLSYGNCLMELNLYSFLRRRTDQVINVWKILEEKLTNVNPSIVTNSSGSLSKLVTIQAQEHSTQRIREAYA